MTFRLPLLVLGAMSCSLATPVMAAPPQDSPDLAPDTLPDTSDTPEPIPPSLSGDWGGARTRLHQSGVDFTLGIASEAGTNVSGGTRKAVTETGQVTAGATVDTEKLLGLRGGTFQATITYRRGHNLTQTAGLDTLLQVQEVYGRGQTFRLTEFWYQQDLGGGLDIKAGRLATGNDFSSFSCDTMNGSFCGAPVGNIVGDFWYNWPVSQWAARVRATHGDAYAMVGAYEVNPRNLDNDFTIGHFKGATGVLIPAEAGWHSHLGAAGLPGLYQVGGWYSTADTDDVLLGRDRRPATLSGQTMLQRSGRYGGFILLRQQLTGTYTDSKTKGPQTTHGLTAFATFTQADRNTSRVDNQILGGLRYTGLIPGRDKDVIGFSAARSHLNRRAALAEGLQEGTRIAQGSEYAMEVDYALQVLPWLNVEPNVQYILNPGGERDRHDVVVLGVKTAITI